MDSYCKLGEPCWPTDDEVAEFKESLSPTEKNCFNLPTFASKKDRGDPVKNVWTNDPPDIIPYEAFTFRNQIDDWKAYFVVMARSKSDVSKAVRFAAKHRLAIGVIATGHEFNDRNSGPMAIQIRTTCLTSVEFDLSSDNRFGHRDGVVRLGPGMTWGRSFGGVKGVQEYAAEKGRVVVSGHAGQVGVVGWSLGGGHGQLAPLHGLGAEQLLEVELVVADGSYVTTNAQYTYMMHPLGTQSQNSSDTSLFWALRGGGGSTWGVITALTIKVHKPRNGCTEGCYTQWRIVWEGSFASNLSMASSLLEKYFAWTANTSKYWSSYASLYPKDSKSFQFAISDTLYVGKPEDGNDFYSLKETFGNVYPENMVLFMNTTFDTFWEKLTNQTPESLTGPRTSLMTTVLLNGKSLGNEKCAKTFYDNWLPRCIEKFTPCVMSYLFMHTLSPGRESDTCLSEGFRTSRVHASSTFLWSLNPVFPVTTLEQQIKFVRSTLAPELYKWGDNSYFSESEYSMPGSEWKQRYWGVANYDKLLSVKRTWDPTNVFGCRHCVGDDEEPRDLGESTMPPWRFAVSHSCAVIVSPHVLAVLLALVTTGMWFRSEK